MVLINVIEWCFWNTSNKSVLLLHIWYILFAFIKLSSTCNTQFITLITSICKFQAVAHFLFTAIVLFAICCKEETGELPLEHAHRKAHPSSSICHRARESSLPNLRAIDALVAHPVSRWCYVGVIIARHESQVTLDAVIRMPIPRCS